jgi:outer membrane protein OmpA-like peptidoglycan-associated protein
VTENKSGCSNLTVTLLLIFMWPIGLIVMWAHGAYTRVARIAITLMFASLLALAALFAGHFLEGVVFPVINEGAVDSNLSDGTDTLVERSEAMAKRIEERAEKMAERIERNAKRMEDRANRMAERMEARHQQREAKPAAPPEPEKPPEDKERYTLIRIMEEEIRPMRPVEFETGSHLLRPSSHAILDEVADAIQEHAITKLLIGGHTDDVGTESDNMRLSQRRSDTVRLYLQDKGVTAYLMAIGFGKTRPVVNATTPETRAQNRRVEFQIMQRKIVVEKETGERNATSGD